MLLIPSYLVIFIFVFVVLPFATAVALRLVLYCHLAYLQKRVKKLIREGKSSKELEENLEQEPEMLKRLITRFKKASSVLEQVNTPALVEQIYSQEKVCSLFCEQIEYFCRIIPNLLLAFGLLGTFLGITISLSALSQTLSQANASDVSTLVSELQKPLEGMGIAFVASLAGLSCSTGLTLFNFRVNTVLAKFQLISSLEDYLDNIYQPTIEGHSRLDKAVEKMVSKFSEFLSRFGETVRGAVESSLKDKLKEIFDANIKATDLATEVYTRFLDASGTLERGATIFQESAEVIKHTKFSEKLLTVTEGLANTQKEISQSSLLLNDSMKLTETVTKLLHNSVVEIAHSREQTTQVLQLTQSSQQSLSEIIPQLHRGAQMFQPAVKTLDELQKRIVTRADGLDDIRAELVKLVETLKVHTEQVRLEIQALYSQRQIPPDTSRTQPSQSIHLQEQFRKASTAYMKGEYKEGAKLINALLKKSPNTPQFCLLQANIYYQLKSYDIARTAYQSVLNISDDLELRKLANDGLNRIAANTNSFTISK